MDNSRVSVYNDDIQSSQLDKLAQLFPEVVTEGKIDWQKLQATLGEAVDLGERYGLGWKGKSDVFAVIQEKTVQTLHPDRVNSVDWDTTGNMFIEGDNLATLKILHKAYYGKVKMIYIDPPYNTGNDFIYNDDFKQTRRSYETEAGITDDEGNIVYDQNVLYQTKTLTPKKPLLADVHMFGTIPNLGISYVDDSGRTHKYIVYQSGEDGSVLLAKKDF